MVEKVAQYDELRQAASKMVEPEPGEVKALRFVARIVMYAVLIALVWLGWRLLNEKVDAGACPLACAQLLGDGSYGRSTYEGGCECVEATCANVTYYASGLGLFRENEAMKVYCKGLDGNATMLMPLEEWR